MKYDEFCLINFYAVEVLESTDMGSPTQTDIQKIEDLLRDNNINHSHTELQKLIVYDFPEKKALLIEKDPFFQKAHYILISNMGFQVDVVTSKDELTEHEIKLYDAVFTRPYQEKLNGILNSKLFMLENPEFKIYLYITPEEREMKDYYSQQGANAVIDLPLNTQSLYDALS